jgi:hypothetical protein
MGALIQTVHIGYDNFLSRAGSTPTDPASWSNPSRARDGNDIALAKFNGSGYTYFTTDLGVGQSAFPTYLYIAKTNLCKLGIDSYIDSSDNGIAWSGLFGASPPAADLTHAAWGAFIPALSSHRYWRVGFGPDASGLVLGEVMVGQSVFFMVHPEWENWDPTSEDLDLELSRTEAGHICHARMMGATRRCKVRLMFAERSWVEEQTLGFGFKRWIEQYVLTGKPFLWAWNLFLPGGYPRDSFFAKAVGGVVRDCAHSYREGFKEVSFEIMGAREWGNY